MLANYHSDYHYFQFSISKEKSDYSDPTGWVQDELSDWSLYACPSLPKATLINGEGARFGWVLGIVINEEDRLVGDGDSVCISTNHDIDALRFEDWLAGLRGRFVAFVVSGKLQRFYLDPMGSLAAVYSECTPTIASTWSLLKNPSGEDLRHALKGYPCNAPCKYYPAGLTRTSDVSRLLPNFYLNLDTWTPHRHWPTSEFQKVSEEEALNRRVGIAGCVAATIEALAADTKLYIGATAGQDSRLILGCTPDHLLNNTELVTFRPTRKGQSAMADLQTGKKVADTVGLERRVLDVPKNDKPVMELFLKRIGISAGAGKGMNYYEATRKFLDLQRTWLTGFGGEVLRTFCFKDEETCSRFYSEEELLRSIELPASDDFRAAIKRWRSTLPYESGRVLFDQLYYEIRHGCWAMPLQYGTANFRRNLTPFSSRYLIETCYSFPHHVRRNLGIFVLSEVSPDLAKIPTNQLFGVPLAVRRLLSNRLYSIPVWLGRQ